MWKRKLIILPYFFLEPINRVNRLLPNWKKYTINTLDHMERDIDNYIEKLQPLDFTPEEESYGKKMLSKFGLKDSDKFACLAVRDDAYSKKKISPRFRDWSYQDYRNCDINNFIPAAEELTKRGYYVFRMGVVVNKAIDTTNPKIIDYAKSNLRSDFMDIYLGAKCNFCVSTAHGFDAFAYIFRRPIIMLGHTLGDLKTHSKKFLLNNKHYFLKKENRNLSLSETFSYGLAFELNQKVYENNGIEIIDNSPEEIKNMVIEMDEYIKDNKDLSSEDEELQKTFKDLYALNLKKYNHEIPLIRMHGEIRSRFSTQFLKKNRSWLR
jgi:putative glycosyltransferase (TIGR04372 family)